MSLVLNIKSTKLQTLWAEKYILFFDLKGLKNVSFKDTQNESASPNCLAIQHFEKQGILKTQNWKNSFLSFSYKNYKWDNAFKNGPSKICGRQPLNNLK